MKLLNIIIIVIPFIMQFKVNFSELIKIIVKDLFFPLFMFYKGVFINKYSEK